MLSMADIRPHVFKIQRYSLHDGPGIRTTLFFQGCPLACAWCHNPESQAMGLGASARETVPAIEALVETLVREIEKDLIFYDDSNGGVTFSGGEPLSCPELLFPLLDACRERQIHTCLDTSGFAPFKILKPAATKADLVLFDIKILAPLDHQAATGKPVGLVLENLKQLSRLGVDLKLRFPLVPTMTDTRENITGIIEFLTRETLYRDIHILPFHNTGAGKYERLNMKNKATHIRPPTKEQVEAVRQRFEASGFKTKIGG